MIRTFKDGIDWPAAQIYFTQLSADVLMMGRWCHAS